MFALLLLFCGLTALLVASRFVGFGWFFRWVYPLLFPPSFPPNSQKKQYLSFTLLPIKKVTLHSGYRVNSYNPIGLNNTY